MKLKHIHLKKGGDLNLECFMKPIAFLAYFILVIDHFLMYLLIHRQSAKMEDMYKRGRSLIKEVLNRVVGESSDVIENVDAGLGYTIGKVYF